MSFRAPSFSSFKSTSDSASRAKRNNQKADTTQELALRRELWKRGLRFRKNARDLPGKPDLVFPGPRIAVFCDGDFWHGRNWRKLHSKLSSGSNAQYWTAKIAFNMARDRRIGKILKNEGWTVLRFWETDIEKNVHTIADSIKRAVESTGRKD
jgi:DNA mismatch endonuclease (patch repair protein)